MKWDTDKARWPDGGLCVHESYEPPQVVEAADLVLLSGQRGSKSTWLLEDFDGFGEDVRQLYEWNDSSKEITTTELVGALKLTRQIIWGDFIAFDSDQDRPWFVITAFDGCWFDVRTDDAEVIAALRSRYADTRTLDPDAPRGAR
ncbi:hypothetical protein [Bosea sp. (in: a-proteobacteria)]|uniref:hypothetical protein n=1 Tax=Bosea sp. (in: a-proteobacteria) TaxID=1871050 RepID=UPI001AD24E73|nr:hypothetical protein [Bosea sp. (in: a-proteobacteria)]MBN9437642.1 hypothetical protein [Bosea sp. (in: a-proteobacteria)]